MGAPAPDPFDGSAPGQVWNAAFHLQNPIVSLTAAASSGAGGAYDPNYNAYEDIKGTPFENDPWDFLGSPNHQTTLAVMAQKNAYQGYGKTLASAGVGGIVAGLAAGALDPTMYLPLFDIASAAREGASALSIAGRAATMGALQSGVSETALRASQPDRPTSESLVNIASNTFLMGILGGGVGMLSRGERAGLADGVDQLRQQFTPQPAADVTATNDSLVGMATDMGAAASDTRTLNLKNYPRVSQGLKDTPIVGAVASKVGDFFNGLSPTIRTFSGDSIVAKRAMADLAETPLPFEDNARGVPTSFGGPPLEAVIREQKNKLLFQSDDVQTQAFKQYRFGDTVPSAPMLRAALADATGGGGGKMNYGAFKQEVASAMVNGDAHEIPEVAQAARDLRSKVLDPPAKAAQATLGPDGRPLLADDLQAPRGDTSYFPRLWNKEAIAAKRQQARQTFGDWLESQQTAKAASQQRLADLQTRHQALGGQVSKLEGRLATLDARQADTASRVAERGSEDTAAGARVDTLADRGDAMDGALSDLHDYIGHMRASSGNPAALDRIDALESRMDVLRGQSTEAGRAANRSGDRAAALSERSTRQQTMRDLLDQARQNAETERGGIREKMEQEIRDWQGKSTGEAVSALKSRDEAERIRGLKDEAGISAGRGERLAAADSAVDRAVKRIIASNRNLSRQELDSVADQIINRILGSPDGRLSYDGETVFKSAAPGQQVRGSFNTRDFAIPTNLVSDFVERDTQRVMATYLRTMLPDIALTQRFGDVDMSATFRALDEDFARKATTLTDRGAQKKLEATRQQTITDLAATRDRIRGTYGLSNGSRTGNAYRMAKVARLWSMAADLNSSVLNRLGDAGPNAVFRYGLASVFHEMWRPMFKALIGQGQLVKGYRREAAAAGIGLDTQLGHAAHQYSDVLDNFQSGSKFERGMDWVGDKAMVLNVHGPYTDFMKAMAAGASGHNLLGAAKRVVAGSATAKDIERLAQSSIDRPMAERIWNAFSAPDGGGLIDGTLVPDTNNWSDLAAQQAYHAAVGRDANIAVITAGAEKPLWMSTAVGGLLGQYRTFTAGSWERLMLAGFMQRDARVLQGVFSALVMGMISYRLYTWASGREASDNPADWIKEGVHRSAILSWFSEANELQARFTGGASDLYGAIGATRPLTRHDHSPLQELLGPTYGRLEGLTGAVGDAAHGVWSAQDTHKIRTMLWFQNHFAIRRLLDQAETGVNASLGVREPRHPDQWRP